MVYLLFSNISIMNTSARQTSRGGLHIFLVFFKLSDIPVLVSLLRNLQCMSYRAFIQCPTDIIIEFPVSFGREFYHLQNFFILLLKLASSDYT